MADSRKILVARRHKDGIFSGGNSGGTKTTCTGESSKRGIKRGGNPPTPTPTKTFANDRLKRLRVDLAEEIKVKPASTRVVSKNQQNSQSASLKPTYVSICARKRQQSDVKSVVKKALKTNQTPSVPSASNEAESVFHFDLTNLNEKTIFNSSVLVNPFSSQKKSEGQYEEMEWSTVIFVIFRCSNIMCMLHF